MEHARPTLGQVIRQLREARIPKLSQEELGRRAGYRTGAGVSMSRIENGATRPGPRRLEGIAAVLGVSVNDLERHEGQRSSNATPKDPPPAVLAREGESTKERMRRIQGAFEGRNEEAVAQASSFNAAHDRARDEFFLAFVTTTRSVSGLPVLTSTPNDTTDWPTETVVRRELAARGIATALQAGTVLDIPEISAIAGGFEASGGDAADREAAYTAVVAAAVLSSASATTHPAHPAGTTARATRALLGGSTRTSGLATGALLTGLIATAASPLFAATTLVWLARRSRRQNEQLRLELDQAEANLVESERGFRAVMALIVRATERLDYIAVHGGHAHRRWQHHLPTAPTTWSALSPDQQARFAAFVELAACQICVDTIDMTELLAASGEQQDALLRVADDLLALTQHDVERLV
jgi:transcriptional regulator with XRE-family HTH domain